jgi:hypothetical protein
MQPKLTVCVVTRLLTLRIFTLYPGEDVAGFATTNLAQDTNRPTEKERDIERGRDADVSLSKPMGIHLKTISLKWDDATVEAADTLLDMFSPFFEGRSQLSRFVFPTFVKMVRTNGIVGVIADSLQRLPCITSQCDIDFPAHPQVARRDSEFESLLARATGEIQ